MTSGHQRPSAQPTAPAPSTTSGKGSPKTASSRNATTASQTSARWCSARPLMRTTAWTTIARTAGARPRKRPATTAVSPWATYSQESARIATKPGMHEQHARDQAAEPAVEQPAGVDRELLRLRSGQQHAVAQRVQEPPLADPAALVDQLALHDRDLAGRTPERLQRDAEPRPGRLAQGYDVTLEVLTGPILAVNRFPSRVIWVT